MPQKNMQDIYIAILQEELVPATGCTEPIALAFGAAKLREVLGSAPGEILAELSGNILKNVKSVVVPNTGGMKGPKAAIAAGIVAGDAARELQVISDVAPEMHAGIAAYLAKTPIKVACADTPRVLDIRLTGWAGEDKAVVHITGSHDNIIYVEKNGEVLLEKPAGDSLENGPATTGILNLRDILAFADTVDTTLVAGMLDCQIAYNSAIAEEGLKNNWGANIGSLVLGEHAGDIKTEAKAWAAAGSDARMSGCELPVVIVSGSGNQGMSASLPVIRYARHLGASKEQLYRALLVSNLVTIYQKVGIGRLSAYCGAVSAGVGSGAGIAYLQDGSYKAVAQTVTSAVAILSGTICDGAKPSCAAKIAASVDAGILGFQMYQNGQAFRDGEGIVGKDVDSTVASVGILAKEGMYSTDQTILEIMTSE